MGHLLNVQAMIVGSFGHLAGRYFVNIRVVDVETARAVYADSTAGRDVDRVREGLRELAGRLAAALL
jgi:curli biogenesis system outer membrane secretion channel CsgG